MGRAGFLQQVPSFAAKAVVPGGGGGANGGEARRGSGLHRRRRGGEGGTAATAAAAERAGAQEGHPHLPLRVLLGQGTRSHEGAEEKVRIYFDILLNDRTAALTEFLFRFRDRTLNKNTYPALHYPEIYLLHNGYKEFYENYPELCDPRDYLPMKDPRYSHEEKLFRKKSKSWAAGGGGTVARFGGGGAGSSSRLLKL